MYGGGGAPAPAEPTAEERRLQRIQADSAEESLKIARQGQQENEAIMPMLLEEYGLTRTVDPATGKISYTKAPDALADKRKTIEGMQLDRSLKALKGELPVTETLKNEITIGKTKLAEKLNKQLGPGWEKSSAGILANAEYDRMATSLTEAEQKDQLTTAEALSISRQNSREGSNAGIAETISRPSLTSSSLYNNGGQSAGAALGYYGTLRNASLTAKQMHGQETGGMVSGGMGLGAAVALAI